MSSRVVDVLIGATLKGSFRSTINSAKSDVKQLGDAFKKTNDELKKTGGTAAQEQAVKKLGRAYQEAKNKLDALASAEQRRAARQQQIGEAAKRGFQAVGTAAAFVPAISRAADFEHALMSFGVVANASAAKIASVRQELLAMAKATNQQAPDLLTGLQVLVGKGMDMDPAMRSIQSIGRAATATGASIEDMSKTAFTLIDALGIKPEGLESSLNILAQAAKEGGFEVKDMAQYFPMLSAAARSLGIGGEKGVASMAAALQVALRGASDPASAANNMQNFFMKMTSEETVKNFKEMGSDLQGIIQSAMKKGDNPMEAVLKEIEKVTGGDPFKMNKLFQDMQVVNFIRPMLQNLDEYRKIRNAAFASRDQNVIGTDFGRMMETFKEKLKGASISIGNFGEALGKALIPWLTPVVTGLTGIVDGATWMIEHFPNATAGAVMLGNAFMAWRLVSAISGLLGISSGVALVGRTLASVGAAALLNPYVLIGAAIVGAALLIYKYWEPIKTFMNDLWSSMKAGAEPVINFIAEKFGWLGSLISNVFTSARDGWNGLMRSIGLNVTEAAPLPSSGVPTASDPSGTGLLARARARTAIGATQEPGAGGAPPASAGGSAAASPAAAGGTSGGTAPVVNMPITVTVTGTGDEALKKAVRDAVTDAGRKAASDMRRELHE